MFLLFSLLLLCFLRARMKGAIALFNIFIRALAKHSVRSATLRMSRSTAVPTRVSIRIALGEVGREIEKSGTHAQKDMRAQNTRLPRSSPTMPMRCIWTSFMARPRHLSSLKKFRQVVLGAQISGWLGTREKNEK